MEQILLYLSLYQLISQISSINSIIESFVVVSAKFLEVIMQKDEFHFQAITSGNFKWGTETRPYGTMEQG